MAVTDAQTAAVSAAIASVQAAASELASWSAPHEGAIPPFSKLTAAIVALEAAVISFLPPAMVVDPPPVVTPPPIVQAPSADVWTRLDSGNDWTASNPAPSEFFSRPVAIPNGDLVAIWDAPPDPTLSGVRIFSRATNKWTVVPMSQIKGIDAAWPLDSTGRPNFRWENCAGEYDESTSTIWWATPAPTVFPDARDVRFDPVTFTFTSFPNGLGGGDQQGGVWNGKAYLFGYVSGAFNQVRERALPSGAVVTYSDTRIPALGGPNNLSGAPFGTVRGGVDHRTGLGWSFNNSNALYMRSLGLGAADPIEWFPLPITTGPWLTNGGSFCLHEGLDLIIGYTGDTTAQSGDGATGTDPGTTYILDLATLVSRYGPKLPATVPTQVPQTSCSLLYDRWNKEVKYVVTAGLQVWRLDVAT